MKKILFFSVAILLCTGCVYARKDRINGSGNVVRKERNLPSFDKIDVGGAFKVFVKQGSPQSVTVEIDDNLVDYIETKVSGGELSIGFKHDVAIGNAKTMALHLTVPNLRGVEASGASNVSIDSPMNTDGNLKVELNGASKMSGEKFSVSGDIDIDLNGASKMALDLSTNSAKIAVSGASKLTSRITASSVTVDANGASNVNLSGKAPVQKAEASGASNVNLKELDGDTISVDASGASRVQIGSAKIESIKTSGSSSVNNK